MNKREIMRELAQINKEIKRLDSAIAKAPAGKLRCVRNGKYVKYYNVNDGTAEYISKANQKIAAELAAKQYNGLLKDNYLREKGALEAYLNHCEEDTQTVADAYISSPAIAPLANKFEVLSPRVKIDCHGSGLEEELKAWMDEPYEACPFYRENLNVRTLSGRMVRSKSESDIEAALLRYGIPFRYEAPLVIGNHTYYPDFTIRHPITGKLVYWEHLGKMSEPVYSRKNESKLMTYMENGIVPGINLIITSEVQGVPLDEYFVDALVKAWFT